MADHELERKLSALRSLLLETTPSYTISVVGTPSTNHDADDDSRVEDAEAQIPPVNEGVYHPYLPFGNNNNASDSEEESEDDEYDGEEDENGADPLWLAAAHGDAIGVATLLKQGGTSSINYLLGASNKESAASSSTSPPNAQHLPMPPAAGSTDRNARKRSTPLAAASARGHTAVVQVLLAAAMAELGAGSGAEGSGAALGGGNLAAFVDAPNAQGSSSLLLAAARGWHEVVLCLLAAGADPSKASDYGETPLFAAALDGHCHVCECLVAAAAGRMPSPSPRPPPSSPVHASALSMLTTAADGEPAASSSVSSSLLVEAADAEGTSPLLAAVQGGHLEVARLLLDHKANPDAANARKVAPLLVATLAGDAKLVRLLLVSGANPDGPSNLQEEKEEFGGAHGESCLSNSSSDQSPLLVAVRWGRLSVVRLLLAHNANPNQCGASRRAPLHCCAAQANLSSRAAVATLLIEGGAHVNCRDASGATPLWLASAGGHFSMVKVLLTRGEGAHVDCPTYDGATPLFIASAMGNDEVVALLVAHGASSARVSAFVQQSSTPGAGSTETATLADGDSSCNSDIVDDDDKNEHGDHKEEEQTSNGAGDSGEEEIGEGATNNNAPPLVWQCAQRGDSEALAQILAPLLCPAGSTTSASTSSAGSSSTTTNGEGSQYLAVNAVWEGGVCALLVAAANGHANCCTLLVEAGANSDLGDAQGTTPLMMAAQEGHAAVVAALLADHRHHNDIEAENEVEDDEEGEFNRKFKRASADLADSEGTTPLLLAAEEGHLECCRYLLAAGAAQIPDAEGFTPLDAATEAGHVQVAALLRAAMMQ